MRKKIIFADDLKNGSILYLINPNNITYVESQKDKDCIIHFIDGKTLSVDDSKYRFTNYLVQWGIPDEKMVRM